MAVMACPVPNWPAGRAAVAAPGLDLAADQRRPTGPGWVMAARHRGSGYHPAGLPQAGHFPWPEQAGPTSGTGFDTHPWAST